MADKFDPAELIHNIREAAELTRTAALALLSSARVALEDEAAAENVHRILRQDAPVMREEAAKLEALSARLPSLAASFGKYDSDEAISRLLAVQFASVDVARDIAAITATLETAPDLRAAVKANAGALAALEADFDTLDAAYTAAFGDSED